MEHLKKLRLLNGMSQQALADVIGASQASIYQYEKDICQPDFSTLNKLADVFQTSVDYIIGRTDCPDSTASVYQNSVSDEELLLARKLRGLQPEQLKAVRIILDAFLKY